jgi:photosystem II stability/assembly factor-like uncharacterized protein
MKAQLALFSLLFLLVFNSSDAQNQYTPYDDLPGIIKSYKPAYQENFPDWAKMLYQYPVNYFEVIEEFKNWESNNKRVKNPEYRYFKIWQRSVESFVQVDGNIEVPDLEAYYNRLYQSQLKSKEISEPKTNSDWTFLGPKETFWLNESGSSQTPKACPWQVNVYSFDVAPSDSNTLFAGTETGFVNRSSDKGLNWELAAPNYFFGGSVTAVAIHPQNKDIVYVAAGNQVHKTTDGGNSWGPLLQAGEMFHADRLKIDLYDFDKIFAASNSGVYISLDGGLTWEQKWDKPTWDVEIKPDNNNLVFVITKISGKFSVVMSTDAGQSFNPDPTFPTTITEVSGGLLAMTPANPELIVAIMLSSDNTPYMYKRNLLLGGWDLLATGQTGQFPMNNGQGYFDLVLEISPVDQSIIFCGTTTLFKTVNGGQQFTVIGGYYGAFSIHPDMQDFKMLPGGETWLSTDGGFSITKDNFTNTNNYDAHNNGLVGSDMWGFDQGWNEDIIVGGRYHNGNTAIADFYQPKALRMGGAESPTGWVLQGKSRHVAFNDLGNGWILPPTAEIEPEGRFIFSKYPNMDEYGGRRSNMVFHPNYYGTIFLGEGQNFWKSTDMGVTYDLLHDFNGNVRYLQISYSNPDVFYVDVVGQGLKKSTDGGLSWEAKPSLTSGEYGGAYWKGKLFFAISHYDENVIYACLQNGTWSSNIGQIYKSTDGGDTWEDWTGSLEEYTKCLIIQPTPNEEDLVYLFTNARNGQSAKVYYRDGNMSDWEEFSDNYPAGMYVNLALPFYRDSKLRVAGTGSVWESPMKETEYEPIINPWVEKAFYNCMTDTLYFDDHSIMNHDGASWEWEITPEPEFIDNAFIRNPKVILGSPGTYSVNFKVTKNGNVYTKFLEDMVTTTTCPSIEDCNNPAEIPKEDWELVYVDSEETGYPGLATMSFDDDPNTIWHTRWSSGTDPYPHEIQVDMGETYKFYKFIYLNRQDGQNGRIKDYELYISEDTLNWGEALSIGEFVNTAAPQTLVFGSPVIGRYFRLLALSEVNGNAWSSAAEFSLVGCTDLTIGTSTHSKTENLHAFPVPTNGQITISLPDSKKLQYQIVSLTGKIIANGKIPNPNNSCAFDLSNEQSGVYFIHLTDENGTGYRVKVVRE